WLQPFALATWLLGIHYGNWAGEWVVGGVEGKAVAYPLILMGLAEVVAGRWQRAWVWFGGAVAWHPVAGGWAGLSAGIVWLSTLPRARQWRAQAPWLLAGAALGMIGVAPALSGLAGPDDLARVAARVHVY